MAMRQIKKLINQDSGQATLSCQLFDVSPKMKKNSIFAT
jgi:hypothetical protein